MRVIAETVAGIAIIFGMVVVVDCLPPKHPATANADAGATSCSAKVAPALLCDRVTRDGRHECAICVERGCMTLTGIYCAQSCDDAACVARPK